jgi:hypothetical protein
MWCAVECFSCGGWEKERLNINVLLVVENHQNAEENVCFIVSLEAEYPFLKEDQKGEKYWATFANHSMEVVPIYWNISRKEKTQLLQKLEVAVKKQRLLF